MNTPKTESHIELIRRPGNPLPEEMVGAHVARKLEEDAHQLRASLDRLCRAVSRRMMPDEPTPEDRMELREAFDEASDFLHNASHVVTPETKPRI